MTKSNILSRRSFLKKSSFLSIAFWANGSFTLFTSEDAHAEAKNVATDINAWVKIFQDNRVVIKFSAAEMGQGVNTSLPMIIAEEMCANWSMVDVEQVSQDPEKIYGNPDFNGALFTAGSSSIEGFFDSHRYIGAQTRLILTHAAARVWKVPPADITLENGKIIHNNSDLTLSFGEIIQYVDLLENIPKATEKDLKPRKEWRLIGTNVNRKDIPDKCSGKVVYSIDVSVPAMLYAAQLLAPVEGEIPLSVESAEALKVDGVKHVIRLKNSVNVLADSWYAADSARRLLKVNWSTSSPFRQADSGRALSELFEAAQDLKQPAVTWSSRGDIDSALAKDSEQAVTSYFKTEHVYHAQMEPLNAVAAVDPDGKGAEVWIGTQSQTVSLMVAAKTLNTTPDRIRLHAMTMGGAFGRRTVFAREHLHDALLLSKKVGCPVKLLWTREDDVKNGWYRPATYQRLDAILDKNGKIQAMKHRIAAPSIFKFAIPNRWDPAKQRDALVMEGAESTDYDIPHFRAEHVVSERQSRVSAWRGIGWGPNCFARECFIDQLARKANINPVDFRLQHMQKAPRAIAVLKAVASMSDYATGRKDRFLGISFAGYKKTYAAGVAEVSVDKTSGTVTVHQFWAAVDPGIVIHPQNYIAQVEGGIIYALSSLFKEKISIKNGVTEQSNFHDYSILRVNEAPKVHVKLLESGEPPSGGGEIGVPMTGAAVANAIYSATGVLLQDLPLNTKLIVQGMST